MNQFDGQFGRRRPIEGQFFSDRDRFVDKRPPVASAPEADAAFSQIIGHEAFGRRLTPIPMDQGEHAASRPACRDALQALDGRLAKVRGKVRDDEEMVFFRHAVGLRVVFGDGGVFVAQIHLDDFFDVLVEFRQTFLDLIVLGPDAPIDEGFLVIGQMHEPGKILAQADGINDGEGQFARRDRGKQSQHEGVEGSDHRGIAGIGSLEKQGALGGTGQCQRNGYPRRAGQCQTGILGNARSGQIQAQIGELRARRKLPGGRPAFDLTRIPCWRILRQQVVHGADRLVERNHRVCPIGLKFRPARFLFRRESGHGGVVGGGDLLFP